MKIDWKYVATTKGYKSLKTAYTYDVQNVETTRRHGRHPIRVKKEFRKKFTWIIARAIHYAQWEKVTIDVILDRWEKLRTGGKYNHWWLNHYGDYKNMDKHTSGVLKPIGINGIRKHYKKDKWYSTKSVKERVFSFIMHKQKDSSTKSPKRWAASYKRGRG